MKRNVWADKEVESTVNKQFMSVMIDVADPHAAPLLNRYHIGSTPTTIITDPHGNVLQQVQGGIGKAQFLKLLASPNVVSAQLSP